MSTRTRTKNLLAGVISVQSARVVRVSLLTLRMMTRTSACDWIRAEVHLGAAAIRPVCFLELLERLKIPSN